MAHLLLISISVILTAAGQLCFRKGMAGIQAAQEKAALGKLILSGLLNGYVLTGFIFFGAGALLWLGVLAKEEVSYAYPLSSLGYLIVLLGSSILFQEQVTLPRILGVLFILIGVFLVEISR